MRLLVVKLSALGDVVHTLPALTTLRRHAPEARIEWLVEDAHAEILAGHPALNRRWILPRREWRRTWADGRRLAACRSFLRFTREFRADPFDLVVDFQGLAKSALWVALARARRKAGFGRGLPRNEGAWLALNERVPAVSADLHALERGLHLLASLGFPRLPVTYDLDFGQNVRDQVDHTLRTVGIDPARPFVAVNPMTRWPTKNWESSRFAAVADALQLAGLPVVFTGGPGDREAIDDILRWSAKSPARLEGRTDLRQLAELLRRAQVLLSTDTGPMHVAAAVGTPVVALFGPTSPERTGPYGHGHRVLRLGLECSPCFRRQCQTTRYETHACMLRLEANAVVAAVREAAAARPVRTS